MKWTAAFFVILAGLIVSAADDHEPADFYLLRANHAN